MFRFTTTFINSIDMKLIVLLISLGFFSFVKSNENITISSIQTSANNSDEFLQKVAVNWTDAHSKLRLEKIHEKWYASPKTIMPKLSTTTTTSTPTTITTTTTTRGPVYAPPTYFLNEGDHIKIADCFYHRVWERIDESDLSAKQLFCKRLADNKPKEGEKYPKDQLNRFPSYRHLWMRFTIQKPAIGNLAQFGLTSWMYRYTYNVTNEEKGEIEDCFFYRSWKMASFSKDNLTSHEEFCMRLSTNSPNAIEVREKQSFQDYRTIWNSMPDIARKDIEQIVKCFSSKGKSMRKKRSCKSYFKLIDNPLTWRDIRRKEVHECMRHKIPNGVRNGQCLETIRDYKRFYFQV